MVTSYYPTKSRSGSRYPSFRASNYKPVGSYSRPSYPKASNYSKASNYRSPARQVFRKSYVPRHIPYSGFRSNRPSVVGPYARSALPPHADTLSLYVDAFGVGSQPSFARVWALDPMAHSTRTATLGHVYYTGARVSLYLMNATPMYPVHFRIFIIVTDSEVEEGFINNASQLSTNLPSPFKAGTYIEKPTFDTAFCRVLGRDSYILEGTDSHPQSLNPNSDTVPYRQPIRFSTPEPEGGTPRKTRKVVPVVTPREFSYTPSPLGSGSGPPSEATRLAQEKAKKAAEDERLTAEEEQASAPMVTAPLKVRLFDKSFVFQETLNYTSRGRFARPKRFYAVMTCHCIPQEDLNVTVNGSFDMYIRHDTAPSFNAAD